MKHRAALALAALLALAGCAGQPPPRSAAEPAEAPAAVAEVVRQGDGWTVEYRFARQSPVWAFARSPLPEGGGPSWRLGSWTVETPGVRLERRGHYDVLAADAGNVPPVVRVGFEPSARGVASSYDPALIFTDGSVALFEGQFEVFPVVSTAVAEALPRDLRDVPNVQSRTRSEYRDIGGRVLYAGERKRLVTLEGIDTYVLFGPARPVVTRELAAIIDPAIPAWMQAFLFRSVPEIDDRALLGRTGDGARSEADHHGELERTNAANDQHVRQRSERHDRDGVRRGRRAPGAGGHAQSCPLVVAHEAAHFWLGQTIKYGHTREAWITEGGADLLAIRTVQALDPAYDWKAKASESIADCADLSKNKGIESAADRGEHRAHYACGALFGMLMEQKSQRPFSHFVRALIEANRADGIVTRADWLAAARAHTRDPALIGWIETMLDRGFANPAAAIAQELQRNGLQIDRTEAGAPRLL